MLFINYGNTVKSFRITEHFNSNARMHIKFMCRILHGKLYMSYVTHKLIMYTDIKVKTPSADAVCLTCSNVIYNNI